MRETLGFHPLANIFPLIEGQAFADLVEDVRAQGVRHSVILFEGLILDGRNRYRAAEAADVDHVPLTTFAGSYREALALVMSENFHRRHLTDGQRAFVAAKIATLTPGRPSEETPPIGGISVADAAKMANVAPRSVDRAKQVQRDASPALAAAAERGLIAIDLAAQAAKQSLEVQAEVVREAEGGKLKNLRTILKRAERTKREQDLAKRQLALPNKKYGVGLTDDEWRFEPYSRDTGMDRSPDNHYPTSALAQLKERDVSSILADDAALWMWATPPMICEALELMAHRGFKFKSMVIWKKVRNGNARGTGYWFTGEHEILLLGTRGNVPAPAPGTQWPSVIEAPVGEHSAKPDIFYELIEEYFPNIAKIELNARRARRGWDAWGFDAPDAETVDPSTGEILSNLPPAHPERSTLMADPERIAKIADANGNVQVDATHCVSAKFVTAGELAQAEAFNAKKVDLYRRAIEAVRQHNTASTSFIQRQLQVSYSTAAEQIARMEREGVVSPPDARGRRTLIAEAAHAGDVVEQHVADVEQPDSLDRLAAKALAEHAAGQTVAIGAGGLDEAFERFKEKNGPGAGGDANRTFIRQRQPAEPAGPEGDEVAPATDGPETVPGLWVRGRFIPTEKLPPVAAQYVETHVPAPPREPDPPEYEIPAFLIRKHNPEASD